MKKRKNNASVGHFDNEEGLEGMKVDNIILQVENWRKTKAYKNDDCLLKAAKLHRLVFGAVLAVPGRGQPASGLMDFSTVHTTTAELESS